MSKAIDLLMDEHRLIEKVLEALKNYALRVREGEKLDRKKLLDFAHFFKEFSDRCHHGKEEERLFKEMVLAGIPQDQGPIAVMLYEHDLGRDCVRKIKEISEQEGEITEEEEKTFVEQAEGFYYLLSSHIQKEDTILYPMAMQVLSDKKLDELLEDFEKFEKEQIGENRHNELFELGKKLFEEA